MWIMDNHALLSGGEVTVRWFGDHSIEKVSVSSLSNSPNIKDKVTSRRRLRGMKALDEAICEARSVVSMSPTSSVNLSSETILYASETQREDTPVSTNNKPVHNSQRKRK
ncbi:hypothetical protein Avbf_12460 [Armadillidium vulgare]|nr:hypothetical protein Avbf_12460 [Armadillidium vulgare]